MGYTFGFAETVALENHDLNEELANKSERMRRTRPSLNVCKSEFLIVDHERQLNGIQKPKMIDED